MDYFTYRDAIYASNLTSSQKLVALTISYHYNWKEGKPAFPSNKTLSKETSLSIATVVRAKKELVKLGWLLIMRRWDAPCEYTPCSPCVTNNEVNNEYNNKKGDSFQSSPLDLNTKKKQEIWRIFENEERTDRRRTAGRSN